MDSQKKCDWQMNSERWTTMWNANNKPFVRSLASEVFKNQQINNPSPTRHWNVLLLFLCVVLLMSCRFSRGWMVGGMDMVGWWQAGDGRPRVVFQQSERPSSPFSISLLLFPLLPLCPSRSSSFVGWHTAQLAFFLKWPNSRRSVVLLLPVLTE